MGSDDAINQMQVQREWAGLSVAGIRAEEEGKERDHEFTFGLESECLRNLQVRDRSSFWRALELLQFRVLL